MFGRVYNSRPPGGEINLSSFRDALLAQARNPYTPIVVMDSGLALRAPRNDEPRGSSSALDEGFFDHEVAGLAVAALKEAARFEH